MTSRAPTCCYQFEIPDPARPLVQATEIGPSGYLIPFDPALLDPAKVIGREIDAFIALAGTYGMGGPGFVAVGLGAEWLVVAVWGAAAWMTRQDRRVEDLFHEAGPQPWCDDRGCDALADALRGRTIEGVEVGRTSLRIGISGGFDLTIAEDASTRPVFAGSGEPRAFAPDDDLRRAVFLSPTTELWV